MCAHAWEQGSPPNLFLEGECPAAFGSNPNQTHLNHLIKVLLGILETSRQVCWGKLELNSAGHRPSRTEFGDLCTRDYLCILRGMNWLIRLFLHYVWRTHGVVSEVWICGRPLAAKDCRACVRLCTVQPWMFQSFQRSCTHGRQRHEEIHNQSQWSQPICSVWSRSAWS